MELTRIEKCINALFPHNFTTKQSPWLSMPCLGFKFERFLNKVWGIQEHEMRRWNMKFDIFSVPLNHCWEEVGKKSLRNSINIYEFKTNLCALAFSVPPQKKGKKIWEAEFVWSNSWKRINLVNNSYSIQLNSCFVERYFTPVNKSIDPWICSYEGSLWQGILIGCLWLLSEWNVYKKFHNWNIE